MILLKKIYVNLLRQTIKIGNRLKIRHLINNNAIKNQKHSQVYKNYYRLNKLTLLVRMIIKIKLLFQKDKIKVLMCHHHYKNVKNQFYHILLDLIILLQDQKQKIHCQKKPTFLKISARIKQKISAARTFLSKVINR